MESWENQVQAVNYPVFGQSAQLRTSTAHTIAQLGGSASASGARAETFRSFALNYSPVILGCCALLPGSPA